jgi:gentisate 1,2-dioxygenase
MIWFDGLDLPLIRNLDAVFFEEGPDELAPYDQVQRSRSEHFHDGAGLRPLGPRPTPVEHPASGQHSPLMTYRWKQTDHTLASMLSASGAPHAAVRFVDPTSGRDIMPTLRAEMHRLLPGHRTPTTRTVGSGIWVVYNGAGATVIDGTRYEWSAGDMFVVPSWAAVDHEATEEADLFLLSDGPVVEAVGLGRTEALPDHQPITQHA